MVDPILEIDYPHRALKNKGIVDSGSSRHMTGNKAYLDEFQDFNGGPVAFGGDSFLGNAKSGPLWLLLLQRQNMLLLQAVVGKFYGFKIKC
ncbi:hypothetical protein Tco_0125779 [Tanacetum coccineum]